MQAGETGKISVKLNTGTHGGRQSKTITVYTNAPGEAATVALKIQGEVWVAVEVQPPNASFGRLTSTSAKDETLVQKVTVINNVEQPLELTDIHSSNPVFKAEASALEPGKKYEVRIMVASALQAGNNASMIEMATGIKEMPKVSVSVNAYVAPDVEVMPASLMLPAEIPTATNRQLFVKNNGKEPLQLSGTESSNPDLKVTVEETQAGMTYKLVVDVPAGYQPPATGDKISIKTNNPGVPLLTVPVTQMKPTLAGAQPTARATTSGPAQAMPGTGSRTFSVQPGAAKPGTPGQPAIAQPASGAQPAPSSHVPPGAQTPPPGGPAPAEVKPAAGAQPAAGMQTNPGTGTKTGG